MAGVERNIVVSTVKPQLVHRLEGLPNNSTTI